MHTPSCTRVGWRWPAYLAVYFALFVMIVRQMLMRRLSIWLAAPIAWVGLECIRNYLLTGISAAMLGHTMADVSMMIQIADLFGSYGVSFVVPASMSQRFNCCFCYNVGCRPHGNGVPWTITA